MASALHDNSLSSDQDTNRFLLQAESLIQPSETLPIELTGNHINVSFRTCKSLKLNPKIHPPFFKHIYNYILLAFNPNGPLKKYSIYTWK